MRPLDRRRSTGDAQESKKSLAGMLIPYACATRRNAAKACHQRGLVSWTSTTDTKAVALEHASHLPSRRRGGEGKNKFKKKKFKTVMTCLTAAVQPCIRCQETYSLCRIVRPELILPLSSPTRRRGRASREKTRRLPLESPTHFGSFRSVSASSVLRIQQLASRRGRLQADHPACFPCPAPVWPVLPSLVLSPCRPAGFRLLCRA